MAEGIEQLVHEDLTRNSSFDQPRQHLEGGIVHSNSEELGLLPKDAVGKSANHDSSEPNHELVSECVNSGTLAEKQKVGSTKVKHTLKSSLGSAIVLRSRSQEKPKVPVSTKNMPKHSNSTNVETRRKKRKDKWIKKTPVNEFSRIRKHLKYLLHRWTFEQNLIDAYSGEGWKGQSLEKIKPEKELQRAKSEIFRCKLKIRDLFQRLDSSFTDGRFPESLFDSEGQIDSEDIFCAKCESSELPADNDIILCDGACERGFHQFCLEPPLLKDDIPPDDEGWLCPGCDCKVDCIELLNDSQGTRLSILDTWEKVFPEVAAAAKAGIDDNLELPSDDSEDNEYDPDDLEVDEKVEGEESSSDESNFYTVSEDNGASPKSKQDLGLSSDDSEDNEYDPNAPDLDEQVKQESSCSDFTSDSDDFGVLFDNTKPSRGSNGERPKVAPKKNVSLNDELSSLLESCPGLGEAAHVSAKKNVERLDYKKLHDGLLKSFKENQYPERSISENLAKELGLTLHQVRKWFENARRSFRHSSLMNSKLAKSVPSNDTAHQKNQSKPEMRKVDAGVTIGNSSAQGANKRRSTTPRGCKGEIQLQSQKSDHTLDIKESAPVDLPKADDVQKREIPPKSQQVRRSGRSKKR